MSKNTSAEGKTKKLITIDIDLLHRSNLLLNRFKLRSFSELVELLIQNELGNYGIDNTVTENTSTAKATDVQNDLLKLMMSKLSIIQKICNEIEENTYISRDCDNNILLYLQPEADKEFASCDSKLDIGNRDKMHPFVKASLNNHSELIRRKQINKIEKY